MKLFGRKQRKAIAQRKARLCTEHGLRSSSSAVGFILPVLEHQPQQIMILLHNSAIRDADALTIKRIIRHSAARAIILRLGAPASAGKAAKFLQTAAADDPSHI